MLDLDAMGEDVDEELQKRVLADRAKPVMYPLDDAPALAALAIERAIVTPEGVNELDGGS